uniref:Reverse transcriptase domain-containing protein n=1 Tax=Haemonchus contortus TaxID=6289 RepID=A0A7I4XTV9_HAECO
MQSAHVLLHKKGDLDDIGDYRPICLLSVSYKLFTCVILNGISRISGEEQPCEQAWFRKGFSTIEHIHTLTRLIDIIINVKRGVWQGETTSLKFFSATLENIMRLLEWKDLGVKVDGRYFHHLRFSDDIVLITLNIHQAERLLADFDSACGKKGSRLN